MMELDGWCGEIKLGLLDSYDGITRGDMPKTYDVCYGWFDEKFIGTIYRTGHIGFFIKKNQAK